MSARFEDVFLDLFGFSGSGALRITPTSGGVQVTSRTYNDATTGTFGQFVPSQDLDSAVTNGQKAYLVQLSRSSSNTSGYRTNIGFTNATGSQAAVSVALFTGTGSLLGTKTWTLKPYEFDQVTDIFGKVTSGNVANGYAVVSSSTPGARFFTYAAVVDNRSGDPIYIPASVIGAGRRR